MVGFTPSPLAVIVSSVDLFVVRPLRTLETLGTLFDIRVVLLLFPSRIRLLKLFLVFAPFPHSIEVLGYFLYLALTILRYILLDLSVVVIEVIVLIFILPFICFLDSSRLSSLLHSSGNIFLLLRFDRRLLFYRRHCFAYTLLRLLLDFSLFSLD